MLSVLYKDLLYIIANKLDFHDRQRLKHINRRYYNIIKILVIPWNLHGRLNDEILKYYPYLIALDAASSRSRITNNGIKTLRLRILHADGNTKITDAGIKGMPLKELYIRNNPNITDEGIIGMSLQILDATDNSKITDAGIKDMPLTVLYAWHNPNITNAGITELKNKNPTIKIR